MNIKQIGSLILAGLIAMGANCFAKSKLYSPHDAVTLSVAEAYAKDSALELVGEPYSDYSRVLIKFDLGRLAVAKLGRVKSAKLRLQIVSSVNSLSEPLEIAPVTARWTSRVSWANPDGKTPWPKREQQEPNIDSSMNELYTVVVPAIEPGVVDVDISRIVDAWIFQGLPNNGLLLRIGKPIWGKPNAGRWKVVFGKPELELDIDGKPATFDTQSRRTIRYFPSAFLPPVKQPYTFMWLFGAMPQYPGSVSNCTLGGNIWAQDGRLPMAWFYGPNNPWRKTRESFEQSYLSPETLAAYSLLIDEWQKVPDVPAENIEGSMDGMISAKKINPGLYEVLCWRGEENFQRLLDLGLPDLVAIEAYTHMKKVYPMEWAASFSTVLDRIDSARRMGMIERTIPILGMIEKKEDYHPGRELNAKELEDMIAGVRKRGPEMPGIAMYASGDMDLANAADAMMRKYYIEPAPEVTITNPIFEQTLTTAHVEFRAEAKPKGDRKILSYRFFVDNRLVYDGPSTTLIWDIRELKSGLHTLTCHAIDTDWNRGAAQVMFSVDMKSKKAVSEFL